MKKKWIAVILVPSLILGFAHSFRSATIPGFILLGLLFSLLIFLFLFCLVKALLSFKTNKYKFLIIFAYGLGIPGVLIIIYLISLLFILPGVSIPENMMSNHYRTNTITRKCNFGSGSFNNILKDPWYYNQGCSQASKAEALAKKYGFDLDTNKAACIEACTKNSQYEYCGGQSKTIRFGYLCKEITDCPTIACPPQKPYEWKSNYFLAVMVRIFSTISLVVKLALTR